MGITSVLMITLLSLVASSTESYTRTQKSINALSQARSFMLFFDREISSQLPSTFFLHEKSEEASGPESSDKFVFTRVLTNDEQVEDDPGDLGTSVYYVAFSDDVGNAESPKLFRKNIGPKDTQEFMDAGSSAAFPSVNTEEDEPVVYNLLKFTCQPKYIDSAGDLQEWELQEPALPDPSVVKLEITFLDDSSAQGFTTESQWVEIASKAEGLDGGVSSVTDDSRLRNVRSFSRTITLKR